MLALSGFINVMEWWISFVKAVFFSATSPLPFADVHMWGVIQLLIGVVELFVALAILGGRQWGRWCGIGIAMLGVVEQLFFVNAQPWWAITVIGIDILIIYALARYGVEPVE
jgi:hypothetical protein